MLQFDHVVMFLLFIDRTSDISEHEAGASSGLHVVTSSLINGSFLLWPDPHPGLGWSDSWYVREERMSIRV
jgi:hypothetical protein